MSSNDNPWQEYERRKRELIQQCLTPEEYEKAIRNLCEELRI